ncbi:GIY-YIG nuclease family protein [Pelagibaculum spongiae]|uniref:Endonuclease n=1 Tax=Pelagibaculum spongiae TaxID=2080658 RepID=A0A2V1H0U0_9GAMM|nr:GIY-YIG nuclease family protein [Pelagibaculum spongiae]PVZ69632.1 endonuclease [Pelagibaculum spongiae]
MSKEKPPWFVYMLRCCDNSLYTGVTTDIVRREKEHQAGGKLTAKYVRARLPVKLVYSEQVADRSQALKREIEIKKLPKKTKEQLMVAQEKL